MFTTSSRIPQADALALAANIIAATTERKTKMTMKFSRSSVYSVSLAANKITVRKTWIKVKTKLDFNADNALFFIIESFDNGLMYKILVIHITNIINSQYNFLPCHF